MALKDSLKHFKDADGYSVIVTKEDLDNNMDSLADAIDETPFEKDDTQIYPKEISLGFVIGAKSINLENSDDGDNKIFFDKEKKAFRGGYVSNDKWDNRDYFSFAYGNDVDASENSVAFGDNVKAIAKFSTIFGQGIENSQPYSQKRGLKQDVSSAINRHFNNLKTTDDTKTSFNQDIILSPSSLFYILIHSTNIQDDYSTKWIFDRNLIVTIDNDKSVTIVSDKNTDIAKDDDNWAFDIEKTDGDDDNPPILTLKATGKADTNIAWSVEVEIREVSI